MSCKEGQLGNQDCNLDFPVEFSKGNLIIKKTIDQFCKFLCSLTASLSKSSVDPNYLSCPLMLKDLFLLLRIESELNQGSLI